MKGEKCFLFLEATRWWPNLFLFHSFSIISHFRNNKFRKPSSFFLIFSMNLVMHFFKNTSSLECQCPIILDNNLMGVKIEKIQERFLEKGEIKGCLEVMVRRLKVVAFPPTLQSCELLQHYINHYNIKSKIVLNKNGKPFISITRETIASIFKLPEFSFSNFSPTHSLVQF